MRLNEVENMKVLIIIPAYNEEESIEKVINNLKQNYSQYDYVIINDGSHDHTSEICHKNKYKIIDLPVNLGLTGAFQTGLKYAYKKGYDYAIQFDADGQHLPEYIPAMVDKIEEGYDMVIGSRFVEKPKPRSLRMLGSRVISTAIKITTGVHIADPTSGMRLFNKTLIREFAENINYEPEPDTVSFLIKQGEMCIRDRGMGDQVSCYGRRSKIFLGRLLLCSCIAEISGTSEYLCNYR